MVTTNNLLVNQSSEFSVQRQILSWFSQSSAFDVLSREGAPVNRALLSRKVGLISLFDSMLNLLVVRLCYFKGTFW